VVSKKGKKNIVFSVEEGGGGGVVLSFHDMIDRSMIPWRRDFM